MSAQTYNFPGGYPSGQNGQVLINDPGDAILNFNGYTGETIDLGNISTVDVTATDTVTALLVNTALYAFGFPTDTQAIALNVHTPKFTAIVGAGSELFGEYAAMSASGISSIFTLTNNGLIGGDAFAVRASIATILNYGTITSAGDTVYVASSANIQNHGIIESTGGAGIALDLTINSDTVSNFGTIVGDVMLYGGTDLVVNSGTMTSTLQANGGSKTIINHGTFIGGDADAIVFTGAASASITNTSNIDGAMLLANGSSTVINSGSITSEQGLTLGFGSGGDQLVNTGTISGNVDLGNGNNSFSTKVAIDGQVTGGTGNDTFTGGTGIDTFAGGAGDDTYIVRGDNDVLTELANGGSDTISSTISRSLASFANFENIQLIGTAATTAVGSSVANVLDGSGDSAVNTLAGLAGNDTYIVGVGDIADESRTGSSGVDTVESKLDVNLGDTAHFKGTFENVTLLGTTATTGIGTAGANVLDGSHSTGHNVLQGLAGNDTYVLGPGDTADESIAGSNGIDTIQSLGTFSLADTAHVRGAIENLTLTGSANANATGTAGNNVLTGNLGQNNLTGGAGADVFVFNTSVTPSPATHYEVQVDHIVDFTESQHDHIRLDRHVMPALTAGPTLGTTFIARDADHNAQKSVQHIIYDKANGSLWYDSDGNGTIHQAVEFAVLDDHATTTLQATDFLIV